MKHVLLILACLLATACQPEGDRHTGEAGETAGEPPSTGTTAETAAAGEEPAAAATPDTAARAGTYDEIGLELPATFTGTLPCADCPGVAWHIDLWPDGVFHLRQEYLERDGDYFDLGRWRKDPTREAILLYGGREAPLMFSIEDPRTLRKLDIEGRPIESDLPYELTSSATLERTDLSMPLHGMFTYMADAPGFRECLTGRFYPVAMEGAYIDLERAYLAADKPEPGAPILAFVEGEITDRPPMEGDRDVPTLVVERFDRLAPGQTCEPAMSKASLVSTYWKITEMAGEPVRAVENWREPHILFGAGETRYSSTVGCNQVNGAFEVEGDRLELRPGPTTLMACPPPLDEMERTLIATIARVRGFKITGQTLELFDEAGETVAVMEAVYLP